MREVIEGWGYAFRRGRDLNGKDVYVPITLNILKSKKEAREWKRHVFDEDGPFSVINPRDVKIVRMRRTMEIINGD